MKVGLYPGNRTGVRVMGRFRVKRSILSHGLTRAHKMRDQNTGRILGRVVLWADNQDLVSELVETFLVSAEVLPKDLRERSEDGDCPGKEEGNATPGAV